MDSLNPAEVFLFLGGVLRVKTHSHHKFPFFAWGVRQKSALKRSKGPKICS